MHPTGTITHGELDLFGGRAPQRTTSTRCTPMVCTALFQKHLRGKNEREQTAYRVRRISLTSVASTFKWYPPPEELVNHLVKYGSASSRNMLCLGRSTLEWNGKTNSSVETWEICLVGVVVVWGGRSRSRLFDRVVVTRRGSSWVIYVRIWPMSLGCEMEDHHLERMGMARTSRRVAKSIRETKTEKDVTDILEKGLAFTKETLGETTETKPSRGEVDCLLCLVYLRIRGRIFCCYSCYSVAYMTQHKWNLP